ncbi:hypothetical protein KC365_g17365 [Hortaea werneckii]|nr:hypothetical protein KC342_g3876 [Hortaea werneckii]KAI7102898.1 hypothetical protein KC339_g5667 [Hortaea werneckii]KAI7206142.1 hypothetical protein KC365_g17365 [Hortaea werneckii]KAI7388357.1 hypothetical protein KC328_g8975 [Hortaea werneckii]
MAEAHEFPVLFTIEGSSRHEVILTSPTQTLSTLQTHLTNLVATSPNCAEFMSKYRNRSITETVSEIRVRWAIADSGTPGGSGRDGKIWPKETVLTEENFQAVMRLLEWGGGRDVLDVRMVRGESGSGQEGEKGKGGQ